MLRLVILSCSIFVTFLGGVPSSLASVSPQEVSKKLIAAFSQETGARNYSSTVVGKKYVGFKTETVVFALGKKTYRVVFSSDQSIVVTFLKEGEFAAQPIWTSSGKNVTVEEIVNVIYSREFGHAYESGRPQKVREEPPDQAPQAILSWNSLMNSFINGDTASLAKNGGGNMDRGFGDAMAIAKTMDPCSSGKEVSQRQVLTDIAQAYVSATGRKAEEEFVSDKSREYDKKGKYTLLKDVDRYRDRANPEEAFRLIQQSRSDAYEIFKMALHQSQDNSKDPYSLAALRNYRPIAKALKPAEGQALVDEVLAKTVVDVTSFTQLRKRTPKASVVYDRIRDQFYVDPTLNSPAQARYLLSLAVRYRWDLTNLKTLNLIKTYEETQARVEQIENAILDENDAQELEQKKQTLGQLSIQLFALADSFRKTMSPPR